MKTRPILGLTYPVATGSLMLAFAALAQGATKVWNTTSGSLSASGSWSATGTPVTTDETLFDGTVTPAASINTAAGTNLSFGNFIWNNNTSSTVQMNTVGATSTQLRLTGGGGFTAATAAGGATGDLLLMGTNSTTSTLTISEVNPLGGVSLRLRLDNSGNFNVVNAGATLDIQTIISESGGNRTLTKTGAGRLTLGSANTFTGGVVLNSGTLALGSSSALGTGNFTVNGGTVASVTSARTLANNVFVGGNFSVGGLGVATTFNGAVDLGGSVRSLTLAGSSVTFGGAVANGGLTVESNSATRSITLNGAASNTFSGQTIVNGGTLTLAKTGGAVALAGNLSINTGLSAGSVVLGASDQINSGRTVTVGTGATFDLATFNQSLTGVVLNGGNITGASGVLTGLGNAFDLRAGNVGAVLAGSVGLNKSTAGTVTLSGTNVFTGVTTLGGGTLSVGTIGNGGASGSNLGSASAAASNLVFDGGTLQYTGASASTDRNYTINAGKTAVIDVTANSLTLAGSSAATNGAITKTGSGTLVLAGSNLNTGTTTLANGVLNIVSASSLGSGAITTSTSSTAARVGLDAASASSVTLANAVDTSATSTNLMTFAPGAGKSITLNGLITGSGILKISGGGDLVLGNAGNSYSGGTEIGTGRVIVGSDAALGSGAVNFGTGSNSHFVATADITSSRAFTLGGTSFTANFDTNGNNVTLSGPITPLTSGGKLNKLGGGTLSLSGNNTYSGGTTVNGGSLFLNSSGAAGTGGITVNSGVLKVNASIGNSITLNGGTLSGNASFGVDLGLASTAARISPGNSPGIQNFGVSQNWSAFTYDWEVNDFTGLSAGTAFDQIAITGTLTLNPSNAYVFNVFSLTSGNAPGDAPNFSETARTWTVASTTAGISGFNAANWTVDASGFTNLDLGTFTLATANSGNDLVLSYTPIPEPSVYSLGVAFAALGWTWNRRRRSVR